MLSCIVYGCPNNSLTNADPSVHYYYFPKHPIYAQQWLEACGWQSSQIDANTARICSNHFDENSYTTEIKVIDYMTCYSKILKYDAVPSLYLPSTSQVVKDLDTEGQTVENVAIYAAAESAEAESDRKKKEFYELKTHQINIKSESDSNRTKTTDIDTNRIVELQAENNLLINRIKNEETEVKQLKSTLSKLKDTYKERVYELSKLREESWKKKPCKLSLQEQKQLLLKVFSESQIKILSGRKKIYWSNDDMAVGYTIRHLSNKRCYTYLTKNLNIPLPAVSSIKRWIALKNRKKDQEQFNNSEEK